MKSFRVGWSLPYGTAHPINPLCTDVVLQFISTAALGGRNPFKNMGSKLVERVRRSLSRSSRQSSECPEGKDTKIDGTPAKTVSTYTSLLLQTPRTRCCFRKRARRHLRKRKKRSAEAKARKINDNWTTDHTTYDIGVLISGFRSFIVSPCAISVYIEVRPKRDNTFHLFYCSAASWVCPRIKF